MAHSFLTRGVHYGALMMVSCVMMELKVPVVPIADLQEFFASDQASI